VTKQKKIVLFGGGGYNPSQQINWVN